MDSTRWQHLTDIVGECLDLPAYAREAHARARSRGDDLLFQEVLSWIADAENTGGFLADGSVSHASDVLDALGTIGTNGAIGANDARAGSDRINTAYRNAQTMIGRRFGAYRVVEEIARGGMGAVYKARRDDREFEKEVAIKVIRAELASSRIAHRFKGERQILAHFDHPNIARLVDGGESDHGEPFIVMEFVSGVPIDTYCEMRALSIPQRLHLFIDVCSAVHYAHQHLVVHRDLKPSNVLVNDEGQVKLLDFGIAKLLDPEVSDGADVGANATIANAMTPAYASPEQVKGETITTASDVYALGVLLFRLLTGRGPYKAALTQPLELAKEIVETDPARPSTVVSAAIENEMPSIDRKRLARELHGDLDNIVLMALRKDPARRYASVEQLGGDIKRYLDDLPVAARADTFAYRSQKFVSRNRWAVSFAAIAVVGLLGGMVATLYHANEARIAQIRAESLFADVRKLANSYLFDVHDAIKGLPGATPVRETLVKNSVAYLDRLSREANDDPALIAEIAGGYDRLGDVQGAWRSASLGDTKGAEASFRNAIELREKALSAFVKQRARKDEIELSRLLIVSRGKLSELLISSGRFDEGIDEAERAYSLSESIASRPEATVVDRLNVVRGQFSLAMHRAARSESVSLMDELNAPLEELAKLHRAYPDDRLIWRVGAAMFNQVGVMQSSRGEYSKSTKLFTEALRLTELSRAQAPKTPQFERMKSFIELQQSEAQFRINALSLADVLALQERTLKTVQTLANADPRNHRYASDVALVRQWVADKLNKGGEFARALGMLTSSETELSTLSMQSRDNTTNANLAAVRLQKRFIEARAAAERALTREDRAAHCANVLERNSLGEMWRDAASAESLSVLPSSSAFETSLIAARERCATTTR